MYRKKEKQIFILDAFQIDIIHHLIALFGSFQSYARPDDCILILLTIGIFQGPILLVINI